jgi:hypothetical protein
VPTARRAASGGGKERRRVGDRLDAAHSAWSGRIVITKPVDPTREQVNEMSAAAAGAYRAVGSQPISAPAPSLQGDPEELPHPCRQLEGGNVAGHVEQFHAKERHEVADDDHDLECLCCNP